jgi:hypothetical protein
MMNLLYTALLCVLLGMPSAWGQSPSSGQSSTEVFTGTIEAIDHALLKVVVKTDVGREVAFPVKGPELLTGLTKGDRVTVQLDDRHAATKIMKAAIPELTPPPADSGY